MHFPHSLTEEEELLQRKYAKLRKKVGKQNENTVLGTICSPDFRQKKSAHYLVPIIQVAGLSLSYYI